MKLSILDQVPITEHNPAAEATNQSLRLASEADALGYHRVWFAEHHHSRSFASPAPEMMTALALERTERIRVGTGGILLPLYPAAKVAEVMTTLIHAHGDRVDTGLGRAALNDPHYADKLATVIRELAPLHQPVRSEPPGRVWVLGAGGSTAPLAGQLGAGYVHGHFFVPHGGEAAAAAYRDSARSHEHDQHTTIAVRVVVAETAERARALADAMLLWRARKDLSMDGPIPSVSTVAAHQWSEQERARARARAKAIIVGTPNEVYSTLIRLAESHGADEIMVNTLTSDPLDRQASYRLLARRFQLA